MEILFLIIWLLIGVWCSNVAEKKGRSKVAWFVIGVIFGIFGLVAVYVSDDISTKEDKACACHSHTNSCNSN